ncbi:MAG: hypothetical protein O7E56_05250 [SAR324 cluster bacterium]|nr:hypothetical protein [SAR324 cluster bacterium]
MDANPLVNAASPSSSDAGEKRTINLVSNAPPDRINGLEEFLAVFNAGEARAEIFHFRYIIQRRAKRALGGKFASGLSTEVTENVEHNLNEDVFGLRRWLSAIRHDVGSIMLLNIFKIKEDALAAPLIFSDMLRTGRPLLVTGADATTLAQLTATVDLKFKKVPPEIDADPMLKMTFLERPQRRKGFLQTVRNVMELEFLPEEVKTKIADINTGGDPASLNHAEVVNLCLLADISSRYRAVLDQFRTTMVDSSLQVPQLISMFEIVTNDIPVAHASAAFKSFLDEDAPPPSEIDTKSKLFAQIYRYLSTDKDDNRMGRMDRMSRFHKAVFNVVIRSRVRVDPFLWKRCHFLGGRDEGEKRIFNSMRPYFRVLNQVIKGGEEAITSEFKKQTAITLFDLMQKTDPKRAASGGADAQSIQLAAVNLLNLMSRGKGTALEKSQYVGEKGDLPASAEAFMARFDELPLGLEDLRHAAAKLKPVLFLNEVVSAEIQKSSLDVLKAVAQDREKTLREIYILNAISELTNYSFHVGEKNIHSIDRACSIVLANDRLGLEFSPKPLTEYSAGLFVADGEPELGTLRNDPNLVRRAYTELVGMKVERLVKRAVDHKINYLQNTYGKNFFEVVYDGVVTNHNLPISRNQFAEFVTSRGILGNLDIKGWQPSNENDLKDPFLQFGDKESSLKKSNLRDNLLDDFEEKFTNASKAFRQLLSETKASAEANPEESNPNVVLWSLFKQGIYNLNRGEARSAFRKSPFFKNLQELIAKISSENYSTFTAGIVDDGIKIFLPWKFGYLQLIGNRFAFLVGERVVKYQLLASPTEKSEELDSISRVLYEQLLEFFSAENKLPQVKAVQDMGDAIQKATRVWNEYSRYLSIVITDRVLSETIVKQLVPGKIQVQNLWFLSDAKKLCLGKAMATSDVVPFGKILQTPENMGSLNKNPKSCNTTIDDFTIQIHGVARLREELENIGSIANDAVEILRNLAHERSEGPAIAKLEQSLLQMTAILFKPIRHLSEADIQALHGIAKQQRDLLHTLYNSPSPQKQKITLRLQAELQNRRSDGHSIKLNFSDVFLIDTTEIRVMQKVKRGDEVVKKQKKIEVEVEATHQTLPLRMREVINTQAILSRKSHVVFSPEGQKKKQLQYTMDNISILQSLRGNGIVLYADTTQLTESQVHTLAARIKPHNFFVMEELKPEPPEGMKVNTSVDALTGRPVILSGDQPASTPS